MSANLKCFILAFLVCLQFDPAIAGTPDVIPTHSVNESDYIKDTVPVGSGELPVLVNKDTEKVEYYRDGEKEGWVAADKNGSDLQKLYDDRVRIRDARQASRAQKELDEMEEDSLRGWTSDRPR